MEPEVVTMQSKWIQMGSVRHFDGVKLDDAQALKPLEKAAEVFGTWRRYDAEDWKDVLLAECADVIQATLNLVAALGVDDFRPYLKACERRNRERERITDGKVDE